MMRLDALAALVGRSLARAGALAGAACVLLVLFQILLAVQARSQFEAQTFGRIAELMPAFMRRTLGDLAMVVVSFQGVVAAGFYHPAIVLLVSHLAVFVATEPAHDVEAGLADLLLARPLPRHVLITRSLIVILVVALAAPVIMGLTMAGARYAVGPAEAPWPSIGVVAQLVLSLAAVSACFGTIGLAFAARAERRSSAFAAASVIVMSDYLIVFLEQTWAPARVLGWLSPFHYFNPINVVAGRGAPWDGLIVLTGAMMALSATAYWLFQRRDI